MGIFLVLFLAFTASAAVEVDAERVILDVDYRAFDQEDEEFILVETQQLSIKNTDPANPVTATATLTGLPADYSASETSKQVTINPNETQTVTFSIRVPHKQGPGDTTIGSIEVSSANFQKTLSLVQRTEPMLIIKEIEVEYRDEDDDQEEETFKAEEENDFQLDKNVRLGSDIKLIFEVENLFKDEDYDDSEIEDIELTIDADESDIFPSDFEEEYSFSDLAAGDEETVTVEWTISDDVDAGTYELEFTLKGEDGKGIEYEIVRTLELELERISDDVRITRARLVPESVTVCADATVRLEVELQNLGTDDQNFVALGITNTQLGINENRQDIELEEFDDDDTWRETFTFTIDEDTPAKAYDFLLTAFIDRDERIDDELVRLQVNECPDQEPTRTPEPTTRNTTNRAGTTTQPGPGGQVTPPAQPTGPGQAPVVQTIESPYSPQDFLVGMIIVAIILVLALIVIFFVMLLRR